MKKVKLLVEMQNDAAALENNLAVQDVKHRYYPAIPLLCVYPKELKTHVPNKKKKNCKAVPQITLFHTMSSH